MRTDRVRLPGLPRPTSSIAERLPEPIEKGLPGPGLLAHVIVSKYADHLPLYRQEGIFARQASRSPAQTMCDWMATVRRVAQADLRRDGQGDPPVEGRSRPTTRRWTCWTRAGKGPGQGRLWISIGDRDHPYMAYDFTPRPERRRAARIFKDYQGYLQADAYSGL